MNLTKRLTLSALSIVVIGIISYFLHLTILDFIGVELPYHLLNFYLFAAIASLIICLTFTSLPHLVPALQDKLGFMFLFSIFGKLFLLVLVFKDFLFSDVLFSRIERLSMLIPIFIFLVYEVLVIVKILNKNS